MSSRPERGAARLTLLLAWAVAVMPACGDDDAPANPEPEELSLSEALTRRVRFDNGTVRLGDIDAADNDSVGLSAAGDTLRLLPGESALLALEVDNSGDEAVEAVLLQFDESDSHIEVEKAAPPSADPVAVELGYSVDEAICADQCQGLLEVTLVQAVRLANGEISRSVPITVTLDCSEGGDPERCTEEPLDAGAPDAASPADASAPVDVSALAGMLAEGLAAAHDALCTNCSDPSRVPCYAIAPSSAIECIETALRAEPGTPSLRTALADLIAAVDAAAEPCMACDLPACSPELLTDALADFPASAVTAIEVCLGR